MPKWSSKCTTKSGPGPFCRQSQLDDDVIGLIEDAVRFDKIERSKFVSMIFKVPKWSLSRQINDIYKGSIASSVYVTDKPLTGDVSPSYWAQLASEAVQLLQSAQGRSTRSLSTCGCREINECETANECPANTNCINTVGGYECHCIDGFSSHSDDDGNLVCEDIDECAVDNGGCDANALCINNDGGFVCDCIDGFVGDGNTCVDVDECVTRASECSINGSCVNLSGSFTCQCNVGYDGDAYVVGTDCTDIDECTEGVANCDQTNGVCTNTVGSFECDCADGFSGNGINCNDVDECSDNVDNCDALSVCSNIEGGYFCTCNNGYIGNGLD